MSGIQSAVRLMRNSSTTSIRARLISSNSNPSVSVKKAAISGTQRFFQTQEVSSLAPVSPPLEPVRLSTFESGDIGHRGTSGRTNNLTTYGVAPVPVLPKLSRDNSLYSELSFSNSRWPSVLLEGAEHHDEYDYIVVGATAAGHAAVEEIQRKSDKEKRILVVPHDLPSHQLTGAGTMQKENAFYDTFHHWRKHMGEWGHNLEQLAHGPSIEFEQDATVARLDQHLQHLHLSDGRRVKYGKLLLTHKAAPKVGEILPEKEGLQAKTSGRVSYLSELVDFEDLECICRGQPIGRLRRETDDGTVRKVLVAEGGFLGVEVASVMRSRGKDRGLQVTILSTEKFSLNSYLPNYLSEVVDNVLLKDGIAVAHSGSSYRIRSREEGEGVIEGYLSVSMEPNAEKSDGEVSLVTDYIVRFVHDLNIDIGLARMSGLDVDDIHSGVIVNAQLEAARNIFVAGVGAYNAIGGYGRQVAGSLQGAMHAKDSGRIAAINMLGGEEEYKHVAMFRSALISESLGTSICIEGLGVVQKLKGISIIGVWERKPCVDSDEWIAHSGVLLYLSAQGRLVGMILWNPLEDWSDVAQRLIQAQWHIDCGARALAILDGIILSGLGENPEVITDDEPLMSRE